MRDQVEPNRFSGPVELAAVADFSLGGLWVQPSLRRVSAGAREELVEPRVMQAFVALAEAAGAVVSRDVLIDRCWDGRIVGDDAINRCIAKVRRLAELAEPPAFSVDTVPRVGYRLKAAPGAAQPAYLVEPSGETLGETLGASPAAPETAAPLQGAPPTPARPGSVHDRPPTAARGRRPARLAAAAAVLVIAACTLAWAMLAPSPPPADRMTVAIEPFKANGTPAAANLAAMFTQAAIERLSQSEIMVVSTAAPAAETSGAAARYILSGTVRSEADVAKIAVQVTERPTGHLLYTSQTQQAAGIGQRLVYAATVPLVGGVEWCVRDDELARYQGKPRDTLDLVLRASQYVAEWEPSPEPAALALGEQALARDPDNVAAQALMAVLLYLDFQASDAARGDAEGRRALSLIDTVLFERPGNLIHRHLRAMLLVALGDLHGAQAAAEGALADEPNNPGMRATLSAALLQQGDVAGSIRILSDGYGGEDDFPATQQFVLGHYTEALALMRRLSAQSPLQWQSLLFLAATLAHAGQLDEARAALAKARICLPPALNRVSALRQAVFSLPDASWGVFKADLRQAGMPG